MAEGLGLVARVEGGGNARQLERVAAEWRRWGLGRRRVCGYSLIGLPGLHATDSLPKLVSQVQTGHMWVSTQFMTLSHPPIFTWHSPVGCTLPCRRQKLPGCDSGGHWRSGPVGLSVRRWAGIGIRRRPGQYTVWWAHGPPDRANRSSRELASPNRPSRSQDGGNDETASQSRKVQLQIAEQNFSFGCTQHAPTHSPPPWPLV